MTKNKVGQSVRTFYDTWGWKKDEATGQLKGVLLHEDLDERTQSYWHQNELRYQRNFSHGGRFFLDLGCGAKPRKFMSENFQNHVCADISIEGLNGARELLGDSGSYVLADMAALPFKDGSFDGSIIVHCLYHVEKDLQFVVLEETFRTLNAEKNILVFYSSRNNLISLAHKVPQLLLAIGASLRKSIRLVMKKQINSTDSLPSLYSHPHNPKRLARDFEDSDVSCLTTFSNHDTAFLRRIGLFGIVVPVFAFLERRFPHFMVYIGKYTCIRIHKAV